MQEDNNNSNASKKANIADIAAGIEQRARIYFQHLLGDPAGQEAAIVSDIEAKNRLAPGSIKGWDKPRMIILAAETAAEEQRRNLPPGSLSIHKDAELILINESALKS